MWRFQCRCALNLAPVGRQIGSVARPLETSTTKVKSFMALDNYIIPYLAASLLLFSSMMIKMLPNAILSCPICERMIRRTSPNSPNRAEPMVPVLIRISVLPGCVSRYDSLSDRRRIVVVLVFALLFLFLMGTLGLFRRFADAYLCGRRRCDAKSTASFGLHSNVQRSTTLQHVLQMLVGGILFGPLYIVR